MTVSSVRARCDDDDGLTLVELIVYIVVAFVVLAGIAAIFVNATIADARARERDILTAQAQVVLASMQSSIRAAAGAPVVSSSDDRVSVRTLTSTGWECRSWAISNSGSILYKATAGAIAPLPSDPEDYGDAEWVELLSNDTSMLDEEPETVSSFRDGGPREVLISLTVSTGETTIELTGGATAQGAGRPGSGAEISCNGS